jgi:hypothetical protein
MKKYKDSDVAGLAFVGFFFVGLALGALYGRWDVGPLAGLGMGFIAMLAVKILHKK